MPIMHGILSLTGHDRSKHFFEAMPENPQCSYKGALRRFDLIEQLATWLINEKNLE